MSASRGATKARRLRETLGFSVRELAREIEFDHGYLSKVENGKKGWSLRGALVWSDYMHEIVALARDEGLVIKDSEIPTLHELAGCLPRRRRRAGNGPSKRGRGGHDERGSVSGESSVSADG